MVRGGGAGGRGAVPLRGWLSTQEPFSWLKSGQERESDQGKQREALRQQQRIVLEEERQENSQRLFS